jgi:hypothetical protein
MENERKTLDDRAKMTELERIDAEMKKEIEANA